MAAPKVIFGAFQFNQKATHDQKRMLEICEEHGVRELDCGAIYQDCEPLLGSLDVANRFIVHGKAAPARNSEHDLLENATKSAKDLGLQSAGKKFNGYYLHAPDPVTPLEETYAAIQKLYESGTFERFGLSNFTAPEVERLYEYGKSKGYVLPTLYQGFYNALSRRCELELLPTLRRLGIDFYAYSPLGASFFMVSADEIREGKKGRFDTSDVEGLVYQALYYQPAYMKAHEAWGQLAQRSGLARAELAWRWILYHSALTGTGDAAESKTRRGDGVITSADTAGQLEELMLWRAKGPLAEWIVADIDDMWHSCSSEASLDCVNGWFEAVKQGRVVVPAHMQYK